MNGTIGGWTRAVVLTVCLLPGVPLTAQAEVRVTPVGDPSFVPTDFHLFAAPLGTPASGFAEFSGTLRALLPAPNHAFDDLSTGIVPGVAHAGPYDHELADGIAASGFEESTTFTTAQYSNGTGVLLAFMLVPAEGAPTGSSPDFASGPIIANSIFPMEFTADTFTDGARNDRTSSFELTALAGFEGHSHIPLFNISSFDFASRPVTGAYEYRLSLLDVSGNGYRIVAPFAVVAVPEPATWALLGVGALLLALRSRRLR
jgi:hypothetical protein